MAHDMFQAPRLAGKRLAKYVAGALALFVAFHILSPWLSGGQVKIQHHFPKRSFLPADRRNAVRKEFLHAWSGYQDHGELSDCLKRQC